jgi:hypothetical protein
MAADMCTFAKVKRQRQVLWPLAGLHASEELESDSVCESLSYNSQTFTFLPVTERPCKAEVLLCGVSASAPEGV